jgi:hypothetical protein
MSIGLDQILAVTGDRFGVIDTTSHHQSDIRLIVPRDRRAA